jgi:hypothetical protein
MQSTDSGDIEWIDVWISKHVCIAARQNLGSVVFLLENSLRSRAVALEIPQILPCGNTHSLSARGCTIAVGNYKLNYYLVCHSRFS